MSSGWRQDDNILTPFWRKWRPCQLRVMDVNQCKSWTSFWCKCRPDDVQMMSCWWKWHVMDVVKLTSFTCKNVNDALLTSFPPYWRHLYQYWPSLIENHRKVDASLIMSMTCQLHIIDVSFPCRWYFIVNYCIHIIWNLVTEGHTTRWRKQRDCPKVVVRIWD